MVRLSMFLKLMQAEALFALIVFAFHEAAWVAQKRNRVNSLSPNTTKGKGQLKHALMTIILLVVLCCSRRSAQ